MAESARPFPPARLPSFLPAPELVEWIRATFLDEQSPLSNPEHGHLRAAHLGALWTTVPQASRARSGGHRLGVAAMAEAPQLRGKWWIKSRQEHQLGQWFGRMPDFLLTFFAPAAENADDLSWCALVEHELLHCGQALDEFGQPRFSRETGRPIFCVRGHDVEEFVSVVRRYGADAASPNVRALADAAVKEPEVGRAAAALACGTCNLQVA